MDLSQDMQRSGARKSLLSGLGSTNPIASRGGLTDPETARALAKRLFEFYNKDQSGVIPDYEIANMMTDVYKSMGKQFSPTSEDIKGYVSVVDSDRDGRITLKDLEDLMIRYLV